MSGLKPVRRRRRRGPRKGMVVLAVLVIAGGAVGAYVVVRDMNEESAAVLDMSRLAKITKLDDRQYSSLRDSYRTGDDLETGDNRGLSPAIILSPLYDVCAELDKGDPLLGPQRKICLQYVKFATSLLEALRCAGGDACVKAYAAARSDIRGYVELARVGDRAVRATSLPRACKRYLVVSKRDYRELARGDRSLARVQRRLETESVGDGGRAVRTLLNYDDDDDPSSKKSLARLRRLCR